MGAKRPFSEVDTTPESRDGRDRGERYHFSQKYKKKKHNEKEGSIQWAKKRARAIERRFQREKDKIPANVQKDLERELAAHKQRVADHKDKKHRAHMIKKYHMVRFFERKKAQRLEKQLQKRLDEANDPEEVASLEADLHIAQVDVNYTVYFPFLERYVSLYPVASKGGASAAAKTPTDEKTAAKLALRSERPPIWRTVEKAMEEGQAALVRLQNRRPSSTDGEDNGNSPNLQRTLKAGSNSSSAVKDKSPKKERERESRSVHGSEGRWSTIGRQPPPTSNNKQKTKLKSREAGKGKPRSDDSDGDSDSSDGGFFEEG